MNQRILVDRSIHESFRLLAAFGTASALMLAPGSAVQVANASPSDDSAQCTFVMSSAKVVPVSGTNFVYASVQPGPCTTRATATLSIVCVSMEGDDSAGKCGRGNPGPAEVWYAYQPGATYVVKGSGCADVYTPPYYPGDACQVLGPARYTL
jgi:hypothetical protein